MHFCLMKKPWKPMENYLYTILQFNTIRGELDDFMKWSISIGGLIILTQLKFRNCIYMPMYVFWRCWKQSFRNAHCEDDARNVCKNNWKTSLDFKKLNKLKFSRKLIDFCWLSTYKEFVKENSSKIKNADEISCISKHTKNCLKNKYFPDVMFPNLKSNIKVVKHYKIVPTNR